MFTKFTQEEMNRAVADARSAGYNEGVKNTMIMVEELKAKNNIEKEQISSKHDIAIADLESKHVIALREKEFEVRHQMDDDKQNLITEKNGLETKLAVAEEKIVMLDRIVDLDSDIVDVKELVNKLIDKLPNIDISSLSVAKK